MLISLLVFSNVTDVIRSVPKFSSIFLIYRLNLSNCTLYLIEHASKSPVTIVVR